MKKSLKNKKIIQKPDDSIFFRNQGLCSDNHIKVNPE